MSELKKILLLSANPRETGRLRVDEEMREIKEGLRRAKQREQFVIESAEAVRYRDLRRAVLDNSPNIVHFSGHGEGEVGLVFEDESGQVKLLESQSLAGLFKLFADTVECVVLNACYSQAQAEAITQYISYVVGMGKAIGDRAAIEFAIAFYDAISSGRDYEFAYQYACNGIDLAGIPESDTPKLLNQKGNKLEPNQTAQPIKKDINPAVKTWQERLVYLQHQEAIAADPSLKFQLHYQIEECKQKIDELERQSIIGKEVPIQLSSTVSRRLTGAEIAKLKKAILSAYPDEEGLEMVLSTYLDLNYNMIKKGNNYEVRVFNLIKDYFEARNETPDLVNALIQERPNDRSLNNFQEWYR